MGTHLRVLSQNYPIYTIRTGFRWFSNLSPCALDERSLSVGGANALSTDCLNTLHYWQLNKIFYALLYERLMFLSRKIQNLLIISFYLYSLTILHVYKGIHHYTQKYSIITLSYHTCPHDGSGQFGLRGRSAECQSMTIINLSAKATAQASPTCDGPLHTLSPGERSICVGIIRLYLHVSRQSHTG